MIGIRQTVFSQVCDLSSFQKHINNKRAIFEMYSPQTPCILKYSIVYNNGEKKKSFSSFSAWSVLIVTYF